MAHLPKRPQQESSYSPIVTILPPTPQASQQHNNSTMIRRKPKQKCPLFLFLLLVIVVLALITIYNENEEEATYLTRYGAVSSDKRERAQSSSSYKTTQKKAGKYDGDDDDFDSKFFHFRNKRSKKTKAKDSEETTLKKKGKKDVPSNAIPIVEFTDDNIPDSVGGAVVSAADALMCGNHVVDYVINATDLRDECFGLKKAFTKTCTEDDELDEGAVAERRRLQQEKDNEVNPARSLSSTVQFSNPVISWQHYLYRISRRINSYMLSDDRGIFIPENDVVNEWENALLEVENGWDIQPVPGEDDSLRDQYRRFLMDEQQEERSKENGDVDQPHNVEVPTPSADKAANNANQTKPAKKVHLNMPFTNQHVSEKALDKTLMLQNEEKVVAAAMKASQNQTNATVSDAAASAKASNKAVAASADFISNVLNDPTSVEARACCASILNVFHENCSVDEDEELSDSRLFIVVAVIAVCGLVKSLIRHFHIRWLPEAAGCILVGVASGWVLDYFPHHDISFDGHWFLRIMVPPIVFEAAMNIDKRAFNRHLVPILMYAIAGTLLSTVLTAMVVHQGSIFFKGQCETIPFIESLVFGSLISSIDPIAVLSVLSNMGMTDTDTIYVVIFGESLLNDGIAIVLFDTLVHFLDDNMELNAQAIGAAAVHFLVVALGSLLVGVGSGLCCAIYYWLMHGCQTPLVEVLMFCCWALLPYYICDGIEWSGIVAVVATGFVMDLTVIGQDRYDDVAPTPDRTPSKQKRGPRGRRERRLVFVREGHLSSEAKTHIGFVAEVIATTMETSIFAYLGLFLFSSRYHWNFFHTVIAIGGCCISRGVMIPSLSFVANWITRIQQVRESWGKREPHDVENGEARKVGQKTPAGVVIDRKMQLVLWFAGLRGAMSFALVENIPFYDAATGEGTRMKSELKAMTSASIIFTVFILGGSTYYLMELMGVAPKNPDAHPIHTATEREMEMIGLIPHHKNENEDDTENSWDEGGGSQTFEQMNSSQRMRQRYKD